MKQPGPSDKHWRLLMFKVITARSALVDSAQESNVDHVVVIDDAAQDPVVSVAVPGIDSPTTADYVMTLEPIGQRYSTVVIQAQMREEPLEDDVWSRALTNTMLFLDPVRSFSTKKEALSHAATIV